MDMFWKIGDSYVNPAHVIRIKRIEAQVERDAEDDYAQPIKLPATPFKMKLTLVEADPDTGSWDYSTYGEYSIHRNKVITVAGHEAEQLDEWLMGRAVMFCEPEDTK